MQSVPSNISEGSERESGQSIATIDPNSALIARERSVTRGSVKSGTNAKIAGELRKQAVLGTLDEARALIRSPLAFA